MSKEKPSYYAILTADVRYDKKLKANEKLLFAEITALCNKNGKCWATNQYFSHLFNVSKTSISKWISNLVSNGYLKNVLIYKEGTKQIDKRYLTLVNKGIEEKLNTPIEEKLKNNITSINTTSNNKEGFSSPDLDFLNKVKNYYNSNRGKMPECIKLTQKRKKAIIARLKEYSEIDVFKVIDLAQKSEFLQGKSDRGWIADIDFIFQESKFIKILENGYKNNTEKTKPKIQKNRPEPINKNRP